MIVPVKIYDIFMTRALSPRAVGCKRIAKRTQPLADMGALRLIGLCYRKPVSKRVRTNFYAMARRAMRARIGCGSSDEDEGDHISPLPFASEQDCAPGTIRNCRGLFRVRWAGGGSVRKRSLNLAHPTRLNSLRSLRLHCPSRRREGYGKSPHCFAGSCAGGVFWALLTSAMKLAGSGVASPLSKSIWA